MPHLPRSITDAAIFLYSSKTAAENRVDWGGSGFLVGVASEADPDRVHLYAVTNDHVRSRHPVIRVEKMNGKVEIIPRDVSKWIPHPDGDDVAVLPLGVAPAVLGVIRDQRIPVDAYCYFEASRLISTDNFKWGVGPSIGDECLMVGRYVNHDGEQFDRGVVRFGNLSAFPEVVRQSKRAFDQESFLVDMRSVSGFSGSAVLIYFTQPGTLSMTINDPDAPWRTLLSEYWVLGIDWGHLPAQVEMKDTMGLKTKVLIDSSMAAVVPAWKLAELLNDVEDVVKPRKQAEAEMIKPPSTYGAELDVAEDGESGEGGEFERFEELARKIVQVPKKDVKD